MSQQVTFEALRTKFSPGNLSFQSSPLSTARSEATHAASVTTNSEQDVGLASDLEKQAGRAASEADELDNRDKDSSSDESEGAYDHGSNSSTSSFSTDHQFYRSEEAAEAGSGSDSDSNYSSIPSQNSSNIEYAGEAVKRSSQLYGNPSLTVDLSPGTLRISSNETYRIIATETGSQQESTTFIASEEETITLIENFRHLIAAQPKRHRTVQHTMARFSALYIFPILVAVPLTLLLSLNIILLTPLYNTIPLSLHNVALYALYAAPPTLLYWAVTLERSAREVVSANFCIGLAALNGDLVVVLGRRLGSLTGKLAGPEWGAFFAKAILGIGAVGGGLTFALLCFIFLRPPSERSDPYVTAHGELRVLSSEQSLTGRVVVGDNLKDGYRFLRCDHSILGGRWFRERENNGEKTVELGDSIFAVFNLQEVMTLAHRSDGNESLITTLALTTDLKVTSEGEEDEEPSPGSPSNRALIIGLGAGITAQGFLRRGLNIDVVEIDPLVFTATETYFDLPSSHLTSVNLLDGSAFISELASLSRVNTTDPSLDSEALTALEKLPKWDFIVQDCFTGGSVPGEMFTKEFWEDLGEVVAEDGLIAMNFVGLKKSKASKAVLVTLTSVFPQCRAFGDGFENNQGPNDITNMVVFCTKTHSPILTFRRPRPSDVHRSPLRSHVFSTFLPNEIQLDSIISEEDYNDSLMTLRRGHTESLDYWQKETAIATWRAMQKILTPEMWMAY
ncbi:hypothetical protein D1P53_005968 [Cryptococcus gattii VGV]|nr:hypothetical protein D1P53_005968 [Cryptococcus gattii VGV]